MDKETSNNITLVERKSISITGVNKIDNFDDHSFLIETTLGNLIIKGNDLEITKLDTYQGVVSIRGMFNSLEYKDSEKINKEDSLISKLFK